MGIDASAITLREARGDDAPALQILIAALGYDVGLADLEARIPAMAAAGTPVLVAATAQPVACLTWSIMPVLHRPTSVGRVSMLVVDPTLRGQGVGAALMAEAERRIRAKGCALVEVTSNRSRVDAHRFYETLGYEVTSLRFAKRLESEGEGA